MFKVPIRIIYICSVKTLPRFPPAGLFAVTLYKPSGPAQGGRLPERGTNRNLMNILRHALLGILFLAAAGATEATTGLPPECPVYLPNVFSPNGDGVNDTVRPMLGECGLVRYHFQVFTRWGQLVFESTQPGEGWNGRIKGQDAPPDTYILVARVTFEEDPDGAPTVWTQGVSLLR